MSGAGGPIGAANAFDTTLFRLANIHYNAAQNQYKDSGYSKGFPSHVTYRLVRTQP